MGEKFYDGNSSKNENNLEKLSEKKDKEIQKVVKDTNNSLDKLKAEIQKNNKKYFFLM